MGKGNNAYLNFKKNAGGLKARNNGQQFESLIEKACLRYKALGKAFIEKTPEPMKPLHQANHRGQFLACFVKQAQPDYKGTLKGGRSVVFEAKHTDDLRIDQRRVTEEQAAALSRHEKLGAVAFVLVSFRFENFYCVPWSVWANMQQHFGKVSVNENDLLPYIAPGIMSFLDKLLKIESIDHIEVNVSADLKAEIADALRYGILRPGGEE